MTLDMIGIIVSSIEESQKFYELLNIGTFVSYGENYAEVQTDTIRISLNTKTMIKGVYGFDPTISGERIELAFKLDSNQELDDLITKIKDSGYTIFREPWLAEWNQYYAIVKDLDGNLLSFYVDQIM